MITDSHLPWEARLVILLPWRKMDLSFMNVDVSDTHIALSGILRYPNFHTHYLYNRLIKKEKYGMKLYAFISHDCTENKAQSTHKPLTQKVWLRIQKYYKYINKYFFEYSKLILLSSIENLRLEIRKLYFVYQNRILLL